MAIVVPMARGAVRQREDPGETNLLMAAAIMKQHGRFDEPTMEDLQQEAPNAEAAAAAPQRALTQSILGLEEGKTKEHKVEPKVGFHPLDPNIIGSGHVIGKGKVIR